MEAKHTYETDLQWNYDGTGDITSPVLNTAVQVATPPDFPGGIPGIWSPEHLFVAAINACLMTTFLVVAKNSKLDYISFRSNAVGIVDKVDGKLLFTEIILRPTLKIPATMKIERAQHILELSEKNCLISNSVTTKITLQPDIIVE